MQARVFAAVALLWSALPTPVAAQPICLALGIDPLASVPARVGSPLPPAQASCVPRVGSSGLPLPDPACTPGAYNPSVTFDVLEDPGFRTGCIRNKATSEGQKGITYGWYGVMPPANNRYANQVCELDHLIPLELGGADTLDNIWPQCGPSAVVLRERFFKLKDTVENFLAAAVSDGRISLDDARRGIATDWTFYLDAAMVECPGGRC